MKRTSVGVVGVVAALLIGVVAFAAPPLSGAIFTTTVDGGVVNENVHYDKKTDVYLDGGPGPNAPSTAAGLPEGDYYFQVTDPSGKDLLSTDHISCRKIHVNANGVIDTVYAGTNYEKVKGEWDEVDCQHESGVDQDHNELGAITVQLYPFDDTPNNGGVYKVWVTRVEDYAGKWGASYVPGGNGKDAIPVNGECYAPANYHGFIPAKSKTDNFKVKQRGKTPVAPVVTVRKFHDRNANGTWDSGEEEITGWAITVVDPLGVETDEYTKVLVVAEPAGTWSFTEATPAGTQQTVSILDGTVKSSFPSASDTVTVDVAGTDGETHEVIFGNVSLGTIKACKIYDRDADGVADAGEPGVPGWKFELSGTDVLGNAVSDTAYAGENGCATFSGLLPGDYKVTECFPSSGNWVASGDTYKSVTVTSSLNGTGSSASPYKVVFTNYCKGTADFGTKGYWHNKNGLAEITKADIDYVNALTPYASESSYFDAGDEPFNGKFTDGTDVDAAKGITGEELAPAGSTLAEISSFLIDSNANGDPREQLAQQLLAFIFNARHRLGGVGATFFYNGTSYNSLDLIAEAVQLWASGSDSDRNSMKTLLDTFNNCDSLPFVFYNPCTVSY